jgi:RHS repeat-associated protein
VFSRLRGGRGRGRSCARLLIGGVAVVLLVCGLGGSWASASVPSTAIRYAYTPDSQLSAVIKPENEAGVYSWDAAGNLSSVARKSSTKLSIIQLEPTSGAVGETVDIWGTGFSTTPSNDTVKFHGTAATVTAATAYTLAVKVPTGATTGTVTVQTTTEGPVTSSQSFTVGSALSAPTISSLSTSVAVAGTTVTLSGTNFETSGSNDVVKVNQTIAELVSETSTSIQFKVPEATGSGRVSVLTPQGSATGPDLYIPPSGYTAAQVASTANMSFGSASTLSMTTAKTVGMATIDATAGENLSVVLAHFTIHSGWYALYSPYNEKIGANHNFDTVLEEWLIEPATLTTTGTYTVLIEPEGEYTGNVKITPYSVVNVTGTLSPTTGGSSEKVSLPTPGQIAKYTVSASAGEEVSLKTSESTFTGAVLLEWLNPEGKTIAEHWTISGNGFMDSVNFPTSGTYTLIVRPDPEGVVTGSAKLTSYLSTAVTGTITPTTGGESKTVTMNAPGQNAKITFSGTAEQRVSLTLTESTITAGFITVYNPEGKEVSKTSFSTSSELIGPLALPSTGTYTIVIDPEGEHTGSVKLSAYSVVNVTGTLSPTAEGAAETVSLPDPGQKAKYTVSATAGEEVSLKVSESTFTGSFWLEWFNPEGKAIAEHHFFGNGFMSSVAFPTTGTYTLAVNPVGIYTGSMKLTAYNATAVTGTITPKSGGEAKMFTTTVPGQHAKVTFSGTAEQKVSLTVSESTIKSGIFAVYTPEGKLLGPETLFSSSEKGVLELPALPSTGTYTIVVSPEGEYTGSFKLTAYIGSPPHGMIVKGGPSVLTAPSTRDAGGPGGGALSGLTPVSPDTARVPLPTAATDAATNRPGVKQPRPAVRRRPPLPSARESTGRDGSLLGLGSYRPRGSGQWLPTAADRRGGSWGVGLAPSPWAKLAAMRAPAAATALAGQALKLNGLPLAGLRVSVEDTYVAAKTDATGRFLLRGIPAGHDVLVIEGGLIAGRRYGTFSVGVQVAANRQTTLGYPIWMTPLDPAGSHRIASPTKRAVTLTTPRIPGLEVRLPAGTVIRDYRGRVVHQLNITAIPVDRPPFPLPLFTNVPLYFTVQPGRAYLSKGAQIIYPNYTHLAPGQRVDFWNYDPHGRGWHIYGQGSVTPNGKQVVPDPGVKVWEFTGAMVSKEKTPPIGKPNGAAGGGDPVDLRTGLFVYHRTDLVIPDTIPIVIERTYRQGDSNAYSFGIGTTNRYDLHLWAESLHEVELVLPNGNTIAYKRITPGEGYVEAEYRATETPSIFYGSTIKWTESSWHLTLTNGTTYIFGAFAGLQAIRNKQGQQLTITREGGLTTGNIVQITSPHGHWVKFAYNGLGDVAEIKDNAGRNLKYAYNTTNFGAGLLESATDPAGRATKYEYDSTGDMTSITDPRGNKYLETAYNEHDMVSKQTNIEGGVYEFSYALNGASEVESTTVTDPRGNKRKVTFNSAGYMTKETRGLGSSVEQTSTFEPQEKTGFLLSRTDARSRKTAYEYDSYGHITAVTRLAGTSSAQTYKYAYEPETNELTKVTDPLGHSTAYEYNGLGELTAATDALGHKTHYEYNASGQPTVITNPLGKKTTITYEFGYPTAVTDPLGRTSKQFVDAVGRTDSSMTPGGQRTLYEYNNDNQLAKITDPLGAATSYEYDADGDLISTSDQLKHKSSATYNKMDLLESETDALEHKTTAVYDKDGNMTQLTDRRGKVSKFTYDALNRLTESKFGVSGETSESTIKYNYDNGNRLTKVVDSTSGTYTPEFDELNRLKSLATPGGTVSYTYDEANRRASMTAPGQEALKYTYDEANRLKELKRGTQAVSFAYDEANRPTSTTLPDGVEEQYGYDEANQLTSIAYKKGSSTLGELDYSYDLDGRREAAWGSYARTALPEAFSSAKYNVDNEQTERGTTKLGYNLNGDLSTDGTSEYKYNARDQLTTITGTAAATYAYDPFGRRIARTVGATKTELLYDGPNVVQESHEKTVTANLLTGLAPDKVFARTTSTATENPLTDALGSTIGLANSTGTVATTYTYDPFGTTTHEGTASENTTQYAGRENDGNGLYYNRARYYSPAGSRFTSQDPLGQAANGPNLYAYVEDSPTNATDPYGTSLKTPSPGNGGGEEGTGPGGTGNGSGGGTGGGTGGAGGTGGKGFGPSPGSGVCSGHSKGIGLSSGGNWESTVKCDEQSEELERENQAEQALEEERERDQGARTREGRILLSCAKGASFGIIAGSPGGVPLASATAATGCASGAGITAGEIIVERVEEIL